MPRENRYVDPLLSNLAVDYSLKVREGLIGPVLFPRIPVDKPSGYYSKYSKEDAYKVHDTTMSGETGQAKIITSGGIRTPYGTERHGLKRFIDEGDLQFMDGPFKSWEKRAVQEITSQLERSQEKRIVDIVFGLAGRSTTLSGTGPGATNIWANDGGDPSAAITDAISQCFYRPNLMILTESVFDAIEYHSILLAKLGEGNLVKKVSEETLEKLFRIDRVVIAKGKADFGKKKSSKSVNPTAIWGNNVVLAYVDDAWDQPCAGKTLSVRYREADGAGYVVRKWDVEDGGILGGEFVQVAHDVQELVVCDDLLYSIKDVLG